VPSRTLRWRSRSTSSAWRWSATAHEGNRHARCHNRKGASPGTEDSALRLFGRSRQPREPRAFEELLSEHLDALYRNALRLCGGRKADAEDLLQDAVLRAFQGYGELRNLAAGRAWLFTILVRTNLNRIRSSRRRAEMLASDLDERQFEDALASWQSVEALDERVDAVLTRERLAAALDALDEQLRPVVWLSDVEGFRQREVAEMLGIPEGTVASRLFRARRSLREVLRQRVSAASVRGHV
jgi:RNA polymerase sigma-70 factor (ECF subfamily)